jgi:hypothetical protein
MKFNYAAGIPGYGTPGTDGSMGLTGLATYFSSYDGTTDSITLKSKIINNKMFFSSNDVLPGGRSYQTGDIFIDKNAKVFEIDFTQPNLYKDTGIILNTSGYFTSLKNSPTYTFNRLSNFYATNSALIDIVYSTTVGDYTTYPTSIYNIATADFAQVKYVDKIIAGKYPFTTWTIGSPLNDDAISLIREQSKNRWHLGNSDSSIQKNVTLVLDFSDVSIVGNLTVNGSLYGTAVVGGGTVNNPGLNSVILSDGTVTGLNAQSNLSFGSNILDISGNIRFANGGNRSILFPSSSTGVFGLTIAGQNNTLTGPPGNGGALIIKPGTGASPTSGTGGNGGTGLFQGGTGGSMTSGSPGGAGGNGGLITIQGGSGGLRIGAGAGTGGTGGGVTIVAGVGGTADTGTGGAGGLLTLKGGEGGGTGNGGDVRIYGGTATGAGNVYIGNDGTSDYGHVLFGNGTVSLPSVSFRADVDTGFYWVSSGQIRVATNGAENFRFDVSTFHARGNLVGFSSTLSDRKIKTNITPLKNSLEKLLQLKGIEYDDTRERGHHLGYIAQDVELIIPEVVTQFPDVWGDDKLTLKAINYIEIIPMITEAIKEQQKQILILQSIIEEQGKLIEQLLKK